jgi:hypothetical protein
VESDGLTWKRIFPASASDFISCSSSSARTWSAPSGMISIASGGNGVGVTGMAVGVKAMAVAVKSAGGVFAGRKEQAVGSKLLISNIRHMVPADFIFI